MTTGQTADHTWVDERLNEARATQLASINRRAEMVKEWTLPGAEKVVLVDLPVEQSDSKIVLANDSKERRGRRMRVLKVGPEVDTNIVLPGDDVLVGTYAGTVCDLDRNQAVLICDMADILLVHRLPAQDPPQS